MWKDVRWNWYIRLRSCIRYTNYNNNMIHSITFFAIKLFRLSFVWYRRKSVREKATNCGRRAFLKCHFRKTEKNVRQRTENQTFEPIASTYTYICEQVLNRKVVYRVFSSSHCFCLTLYIHMGVHHRCLSVWVGCLAAVFCSAHRSVQTYSEP